MITRLRQIVLVAETLEPAVGQLCEVFGIEVGYRDPGVAHFGLENAVIPIGTQFLEVVAPTRVSTTAARLLERRGGAGGYMVILQTDDIAADRERCDRLGVRRVWNADLPTIRASHLHPRDIGGAIVSLDEPLPCDSWLWGGPGWQDRVHTEVVEGTCGVELQAANPAAMAQRWAEVLGLAWDGLSSRKAGERWTLMLPGAELRFVRDCDGRGDGVRCFDLKACDGAAARARAERLGLMLDSGAIAIGGVEFRLVAR
ncbi:MAG: VOC family protein [Myxococcales bacterium]|nr:VOC family protein [Myxococcales bacterium]